MSLEQTEPAPAAGQETHIPHLKVARRKPNGRGHGEPAHLDVPATADRVHDQGHATVAPQMVAAPVVDPIAALDELCAEVRNHHKRGAFMMKQRVGMQNRTLAFVRTRYLGWHMGLTEDERSAIAKKAAKMVKDARQGKGLPELVELVTVADNASDVCEKYEVGAVRQLERLARLLPGAAFVESVRGFGFASFGRIIGETGPLNNYANPDRMRKRLGLAVIDGEAQRKHANAELADIHRFSPLRRAVSWVGFESVFKSQLLKDKEGPDEGVTKAIGPYGEAYLYKKAEYVARSEAEEWPIKTRKLHVHRMASRYAEKLMLKHLWQAWRDDLKAITG